jgi:thiol-disulfide isomerase/thioredoxin
MIPILSIQPLCRHHPRVGDIRRRRASVFGIWLVATWLLTNTSVQADVIVAHSDVAIPTPSWSLPAIANADGTLGREALLGKVVYLDFWASWCGPCRISLPALNALRSQFEPDDVIFVAVSIDVVAEDALDFLKRYPVDYPVLLDSGGDVAREFAVNGMPAGFYIDRVGNVRGVHVGFSRGEEQVVAAELRRLLAESPAE